MMSEEMEIIKSLSAALEKKMEIIADKDMEIAKYKLLITERKESNSDDWFLIYSNDFNDQSTQIICQNLMEFGELAYNHGQQLIARQECNLAFCIYLAPFKDNSNLSETIDAIEDLIEKKILEEDENEHLPVGRIVPQMKQMANKLEKLEKVVIEKEKLRIGTLNSRFHAPKYFDQAIKSPIFIEKLCQYLSEDHDSDDSDNEDLPPPFANMTSLTEKRKHLMDFLKYLKANVNGDLTKTPMQTAITKRLADVNMELVDLLDTEQMEKTKMDFKVEYGLDDTIGTIHVYYDRSEEYYEYFIVVNGCCYKKSEDESKEEILESIHDYLNGLLEWPKGARLATDLDVPKHLSDWFVHTSNKDVFSAYRDVFEILIEMNDAKIRFCNTMEDSLSLYQIDDLFMGFLHGKL